MRPEKESMANEIREWVAENDYALMVDYRGMTVEQMEEFRSQLRESQARCQVVKNSLLRKIGKEKGWEVAGGLFDGPTAVIAGEGEVTALAALVRGFAKKNTLPAVKGGIMGVKALSADDVNAMALLPSREVMLSRVVGTVAAPMSQLVGVMNQKLLSLLYVLKAVEEKKA